jgi:hypothetical protein
MSVLQCVAYWWLGSAARPRMEPMPATQTYSLRLDQDRRSKLEEIARRKDRDLSYVIRRAIDEYIERHQHDPNGD